MKPFYVYGVVILVIDPIDSAVLGMMNMKKMHGKSITSYLFPHQKWDPLTAQRRGLWPFQVA